MFGDIFVVEILCLRNVILVFLNEYFWVLSFNFEFLNFFSIFLSFLMWLLMVLEKMIILFMYIRYVFYSNFESIEFISFWKVGVLLYSLNGI